MSAAKTCEINNKKYVRYDLPIDLQVSLQPRSTCGLKLYAFDSKLQFDHQWPVTVYHNNNGAIVNYTNTSSMLWNKKLNSDGDCLNSKCSETFDLVN